MTEKTWYGILYYLALVCAVWFMLTGWLWTYYGNLFISFPFGILSLIIWKIGTRREENKARYKKIIIILAIGVVVSLLALAGFLLTN